MVAPLYVKVAPFSVSPVVYAIMSPMQIPDPDDLAGWLSVAEAAHAYGKSTRTLRRLLAEGALTAQRVQGPPVAGRTSRSGAVGVG